MKKDENSQGAQPFSRRVFAKAALGTAGVCYAGALGYPVYRYLSSPVEKAAAMAAVTEVICPNLKNELPVGQAKVVRFGVRPVLIIRHAADTWVALDAVCTHLGCTVAYEPGKKRIHCACHGGVYDAETGRNVSGPPPKPLKQYVLTVSGNDVILSRA